MSLTGFFKENVVDPFQEVEFVVSDRFKDENGNPIKWKLRAMSPDAALQVSDESVVINNKSKKADFKTAVYQKNVVVKSVVYPDLTNAELQDSYGVMDAHSLINKMLNADEFNDLLSECTRINGLNKSFEDKKDEVKN